MYKDNFSAYWRCSRKEINNEIIVEITIKYANQVRFFIAEPIMTQRAAIELSTSGGARFFHYIESTTVMERLLLCVLNDPIDRQPDKLNDLDATQSVTRGN